MLNNHVVLMGFKHVGKTAIGKQLAIKMNIDFIDLDHYIENIFALNSNSKLTCRQIMEIEGEKYFRDLETRALHEVMQLKNSVVSLGGGTPLSSMNQNMLTKSILIHITAPKAKVYERIYETGKPTFIHSEADLTQSLELLWNERMPVYESIQHYTVMNNSTIDDAVDQIVKILNINTLKISGNDYDQ